MKRSRSFRVLISLLLVTAPLQLANAQAVGEYPTISSVATYRPITASSVCGANGGEEYCEYTADAVASLAPNCLSQICDNTCPHSASSPNPVALATLGSFVGVTTEEGRPGSTGQALRFNSSFVEVSAAFVPPLSGDGFSFATWINQDEGNEGTLLSKSSSDGLERNYVLTVSEQSISLDYLPSSLDVSILPPGSERYRTISVGGLSLSPDYWHHIAVTVYQEDAAFYVNGSVINVQSLEGAMVDESRNVYLGQTIPSVSFYSGLMQMMFFYARALTAREVSELVTGSLAFVHPSTECHCPPSLPVIDPNDESVCIQHLGDLVNRGFISRLNPLAHPPGFLNDFGATTGWISSPGDQAVSITVNLTYSLYELIFVNLRFGSPRPKAAILETSKDGGLTFDPIQYYADDCMLYFSLPDNGPIVAADDVNCITTDSGQIPTYNGDVRTLLLNTAIRNFDLNTSPELRDFIQASHLRLSLIDYFNESTTPPHLYYSILEITVAARCACNGHSSRCGTEIDAVCQCLHNTQGARCEECQPLYNDKPWQYGITGNAFPCKLCNCNSHASSCFYNVSVDPFPESHELGGGGTCVSCQDNTTGQFCESCGFGYYRPVGVEPSDPTPCVECGCDERGVEDGDDCVKSENVAGEVAGQCFCKENVMGLKCDVCNSGFYDLSADNPAGCRLCDCNTAGTFEASTNCNVESGQCICKTNVEGLRCDRCRNGTTGLTPLNPLGCVSCSCDLTGSESNNCDPTNGVCTCKPGIGGDRCDQCLPGFFGFSDSGCQPCKCDPNGAFSNVCNTTSGQCTCRENVFGANCDSCIEGFYDIVSGCMPCECETAGTVNGTGTCNALSGQCDCKSSVEGRTCDTCSASFTNLTASNPEGCSECYCVDLNTDTSGTVCDPVTSQCECLPSATGLQCDLCRDNFYFNLSSGCVPCDCHPEGTDSDTTCNPFSGVCTCSSAGVGGRQCSECLPGFFQFPSCQSCGCHPAGATTASVCNADTGVCMCKQYVTGATCDSCIPEFQMLDAANPFGCTAAPDEQAPPFLIPLDSTTIFLGWLEPEAPNGVISGYNVYRNGFVIATITEMSYNDTGLTPSTEYSYIIEAFNVVGATSSFAVQAQTLEGVPTGILQPFLEPSGSTAVLASWQEPAVPNGVIARYELVIVAVEGETTETTVFSGLAFSTTVSGLDPFTQYYFELRACTSGGCGSSEPTQVLSGEAPPTFQPAPNVTVVSATSLLVTWAPPPEPNGIITHYIVYQRNEPFQGEGFSVGNVSSEILLFVVRELRPFVTYEFRVVSFTVAGGTASEWTAGQTEQSAPEGVLPPNLAPLSSSSIQVNWTEPESPNGDITLYRIYMVVVESGSQTRILLLLSSDTGSHTVEGLDPFTEYHFLVEACTEVNCTASELATVRTLESAPVDQSAPTVTNTTATSVSLQWTMPLQPNGIVSNYVIQRRLPSLLPSPSERDVGISFDGNSFATFSSSTLGGFRNEISLRFRTLSGSGTLLYYISSSQSDLIAIELRSGVPWFVFDVGTGPAAIRPEVDATFNDGLWHSLVAIQEGVGGSITIDGIYTGSGNAIGTSQVLSSNLAVFIGGIQSQSPLASSNGGLNPNATLDGTNFAGCLFDVKLNSVEVDFSTQVDPQSGVGMGDLGCPINGVRQTQFLGGGYLQLGENTISSSRFSLTFDFRTTDSSGLLLFGYDGSGNSSFGVEIRDSLVYLSTWIDDNSFEGLANLAPVCDGLWHTALLEQSGDELALVIDGSTASTTFPHSNIVFSSSLFFGGVPSSSLPSDIARTLGLDVYTPFSGCTRTNTPYLFMDGIPVETVRVCSEFVRFDQCGDSPGASCTAPWASIDAGEELVHNDIGLTPFSDYLYRVSPENSAGRTFSPWVAAMTEPSAPTGVGSVSLLVSTQSSFTVSWRRPAASNGLITRYDVTAEPLATIGLRSPLGGPATTTLEIQEPEVALLSTLTGLEPATTYSITLWAYTLAGRGGGTPVQLMTNESVPIGVQPPLVAAATARALTLAWAPPTQPNGYITRYDLFVNNELHSSGLANSTTVDSLDPFTQYSFYLQACTSAGCSNSSVTVGQTLPDSPTGLAGPNLTALSPSSIEAVWSPPASSNGELVRYELRRLFGAGLSEIVYVGLDLSTTVFGLTPNTEYFFQLLVFNAGGFASSPVVSIQTLEDIPDGISAPVITVISATSLLITWEAPESPNGDIIQYILSQNGEVVFSNATAFSYLVTDLEPFTAYSYSIMACTVEGCGSSNHSTATTLEAVPEGYIQPTIASTTPTSFTVVVNPVTRPNGVVTYMLYVAGEFADSGSGSSTDVRLVYSSVEPGSALVTSLLPYTDYEVTLVVMNSAGNLTGDKFTVRTDPTAPEGLAAPTLSLVDATTLLVEWSPPSRPNGMLEAYQLSILNSSHLLTFAVGLNTSAVVGFLRPFTLYQVFVTVNNTVGSVDSSTANITTGETAPSGFDQVQVVERGSRYILISWDRPAASNGILVNYTVLQGGVAIATVAPSVLEYEVMGLLPFSEFTFSVVVCTVVGCVEGPNVTATTLEDIPEDVRAPLVTNGVGSTVLVSWASPGIPNGVIFQYYVERSLAMGAQNFSRLGVVEADVPLVFVDDSTTPFTGYLYRVVAENNAGESASPFTMFRTPEAAPEGVVPPLLTALSSSEIQVLFRSSLVPNGILISHTLTRTSPSTSPFSISLNTSALPVSNDYFVFTDALGLLPYTNYTYILTICTNGGCTDSTPALVTTFQDTPQGVSPPNTTVIEFDSILVSWKEPERPNGEVISYELLRRNLGFEDSSAGEVNCCEEYVVIGRIANLSESCSYVALTGANTRNYTDVGLQAFSVYQYCIVVTNGADSAPSEPAMPTQTSPALVPLRGPRLNATTVNSTAIDLSWDSLDVSELLGPLEGYTLYRRVSGTAESGEILFSGLEQTYTATGLIASTEYSFFVAVSNGRGQAFSNNASALTEEGIPMNLTDPVVLPINATTISITWVEPQQPNGVITSYTIFLDSIVAHNDTQPGTRIVSGLAPYTQYFIQAEACTQFGCTRSSIVAVRTLESPPRDVPSPVVIVTGSTSVSVSWREPLMPNGNITEYRLYVTEGLEERLLFSGLAFEFTVDNLCPFTTYMFRIVAFNGAGNGSSGAITVQTDEAAPSLVAPPTNSVLSSSEISLSWFEPPELNGVLTGYQLYRNGLFLLSTFATSLTDSSLEPFTAYTYILEVCTNGGCTNSTEVSNTTFEAIPEGISNLTITNLQPRSLVLNWQPPAQPNGIITEYILVLLNDDSVIFQGLALSFTASSLVPFTSYSFQLLVCNSASCNMSAIVVIQTPPTDPEGLDAPRLRNINSMSVDVEWSPPDFPNGNITQYIISRGENTIANQTVVFQGLAFSYIDTNLVPDTMYSYTVGAVNSGGSTESPASYITTIADLPDDIALPTVEVLGSTSIRVTWSEPGSPNGVVSQYILYQDDSPVLGIGAFEHTATGLTPFTVYVFYLQVCNQAGCASTPPVSATTDQAHAIGVTPPTPTVLGSMAIQVSWVAPTMPNGIISRYEIRRRLFNAPLTESIQHIGDASILSFTNIGLEPFTTYEYRLRVTNGAGSVLSEWVAATTLEDLPQGVSPPVIADSDIFARNVTATWSSPTSPNGIVLSYRLEYRLLLGSTIVTAAVVTSSITEATATGLLPVTTYEFRVIAINAIGEGESEWVAVITSEDVPEGIQPIVVEERTGTTLVLTWDPPLTPNGVILEYMLFLDGDRVYRDSLPMYTVLRLQPFTSYTLQLAACTSAGCTFGEVQSVTTDEIAPFGQSAPTLMTLSPPSVEISWDPPAQPNGIITTYEILRERASSSVGTVLILSTSDTVTRRYVDEMVLAATIYNYAIRVINSAGQTESDFSSVTTAEAPPEGLTAPTLSVLSSTSISVSWLIPSQPNGDISEYRVNRTGAGNTTENVYVGQNRQFTDTELSPFTVYSYTFEACTSGGCSTSLSSSTTTFEDEPEGLSPPVLAALSATEISIQWSPPTQPNGIITHYTVIVDPVGIQITSTNLAATITNLSPFTLYTVTLEACNSVACAVSSATVQTDESTPGFISPPQLVAINATAVEAVWQEPTRPNGIIIRYDLRRDSNLVFTTDGATFRYVDGNLSPNELYSYTIQAYTSIGPGAESSPREVQTPPDTPEEISPPLLEVLSASSILARWSEPGKPNGVITSYRLEVNGAESFRDLAFEYTVEGLTPYTVFEFRLVVCTSTCGFSDTVTARTAEASPTGQDPPQLVANPDTSVSATWTSPAVANGNITTFDLERRLVQEDGISGAFETVFSGLSTLYVDIDPLLRPATVYEYRVSAINAAGRATSEPSAVTLLDAPPEGVNAPLIQSVTSTMLVAIVPPPVVPNGQLTLYKLYQNQTLITQTVPESQTSAVQFSVSDLQPFTGYSFHIEVCTVGGCSPSAESLVRTAEAPPSGLTATSANVLSSRTIEITWEPPSKPNGIILTYTLFYRLACPQPAQATCTVGVNTTISDGIPASQLTFTWMGSESSSTDPVPYTAYQFYVEAENSAGRTSFEYSTIIITPTDNPEVISGAMMTSTDQETNVVTLDWSDAFRLNGPLQGYTVMRNGIIVHQTTLTNVELRFEPMGIPLEYVVSARTEVGVITTEVYTLQLESDQPTGEPTETTTVTPPSEDDKDTPVYQTAAFIIGMVLIGIAILFSIGGIFLCCIRPRGDTGYKTTGQPLLPLEATPTPTPNKSPFRSSSPAHRAHEPVTGSWSPGDATWELPDLGDEEGGLLREPEGRSYSPKKAEMAALLEHEVTEPTLPDTHISGYAAPPKARYTPMAGATPRNYELPATDDFGSFKAQSQQHTTFQDTKV